MIGGPRAWQLGAPRGPASHAGPHAISREMPGPRADAVEHALVALLGPARVSVRAADLATYARDMWPRALLAAVDGGPPAHPPDVVVWPETTDEVVQIVRLARRLGAPVVPYGAGSGVCGGAVPLHGGITIDLKRMDRVLSIDRDALVCEAEAGINGEHLERELARKGLTLGHFPSSIYCSTLGGWLATRSGGQMSTRYGKIEDVTLGLTCVTGAGDLLETGRHGRAAAGPDFTQLLLGSEGTLGVITRARLRVRPAPEVRHLRGFVVDDLTAGTEAIRRVLQRGLQPAVVRLYDALDSLMALRHARKDASDGDGGGDGGGTPAPRRAARRPGPAKDLVSSLLARLGLASGGGLTRELVEAALSRPRLVNLLADRAAGLAGRGCLMIIGVEGSRARADVEAELVFAELTRAGARDLGPGPGERWFARRYAVSYEMPRIFTAGAFVDTMEVASTWERLPDLFDSVRRAISRHAFVMAHFSHAYVDGCSIYFSFAASAPNREAAERRYDALWHDALTAATRAGGTISHHHGVGLLKADFMADEHRESMAVFHALKASLDPDGIMNPGKMGLPLPEAAPWSR